MCGEKLPRATARVPSPGDRGGEEKDEKAERRNGRRQLRRLRLGHSLLRQEEEGEESGASHAGYAGERRQRSRHLFEPPARHEPDTNLAPRSGKPDRAVGRRGDAPGQQARVVEVAA
jgi:hypothetical protein